MQAVIRADSLRSKYLAYENWSTYTSNERPLCGSVKMAASLEQRTVVVWICIDGSIPGMRSIRRKWQCRPRSGEGSSRSKESEEHHMDPWVDIKLLDESVWQIADINLVMLQLMKSRAHEACVWVDGDTKRQTQVVRPMAAEDLVIQLDWFLCMIPIKMPVHEYSVAVVVYMCTFRWAAPSKSAGFDICRRWHIHETK
jgi:hypothetical protein